MIAVQSKMPSRAELCAELYRRGNYSVQAKTPWGVHQKQLYTLQLLNSPDITSIGYGGSARGGKSWIASEWLVMNCLAYANTGWGLGRKELKTLKRTTLLTLFKVFSKYKLEFRKDYVYNQQDQIITFKNFSQIFLIDTAHQPNDPLYTRFGGYELTGCVIDESNETPYEAIEILSGRCGFRKNIEYNLPARTLETFNPDKGHVYNRFYLPHKNNKEQPNTRFIKALPADNPDPAVTIWVKQQIETASEITIQRLVYGNFDYDESKDKLIEPDADNDYFTNSHVKLTGIKYITADIARMGRDSTMIRVWDGLTVIDRKEIKQSRINETVDAIRAIAVKYSVPMSKTIVDEDGVGCLVAGTRVLTTTGWKIIQDIKKGEFVYSKDLNGKTVIAKVTGNIKREKTDIIEDKSGVSFSFSHFLPYRTRLKYKLNLHSWDAIMEKKKVYLDSEFKWKGRNFTFKLPATKHKQPNGGYKTLNNSLNINSKTFASFIGWFVSEGCIDGKYIKITQNINSIYNEKIRKTLKDCGFNVYEKTQSNKRAFDYFICNRQLRNWLKENCYTCDIYKSFNKKVPTLIKNGTTDIINSFLDSFCDGDGYYHYDRRNYCTSSETLAYDLHELTYKIGKQPSLSVRHKKGSTGLIDGRVINRKRDNYLITELKENVACIYPETTKIYEDHVYNLEIDSPTKLYAVMFDKYKRTFFVHNGGVRDYLRCYGFVANAKVIGVGNYQNLKSQCNFMMAQLINDRKVYEPCTANDIGLVSKIKQEMDWVRERGIDQDGKRRVISKDEVKAAIRRSPDEWDSIYMRAFFELGTRI